MASRCSLFMPTTATAAVSAQRMGCVTGCPASHSSPPAVHDYMTRTPGSSRCTSADNASSGDVVSSPNAATSSRRVASVPHRDRNALQTGPERGRKQQHELLGSRSQPTVPPLDRTFRRLDRIGMLRRRLRLRPRTHPPATYATGAEAGSREALARLRCSAHT